MSTVRASRPDLGSWLDEVYPVLFDRLDSAFPEFGFQRRGDDAWVATLWPASLDLAANDKRPDRLMCYRDRPWWLKLHGHEGVRWLVYVARDPHPRGEVFLEACRRLAVLSGVPFPATEPTEKGIARAVALEERRRALEVVVEACALALASDHETAARARAFLAERGFSDADVEALNIGLYLSRNYVAQALECAGVERETARDAGVLWDKLEGYVVLPWRDAAGRVLTLYGRWHAKASDGRPKTIALPGADTKGVPLYFDRARRAKAEELVLVEGIFDAALLQARGDHRVVASVAAQLSGGQLEALKRHGVKRVIVCGDPDGGGDRGTVRNVHLLAQAGIGALVAPRLPDGLDPDEFVKRDGIDAWRAHVARAVSGARFLVEQAAGDVTRESLETARRSVVDKVIALLAEIPPTIDDGNALATLAARTGYPRRGLETQLRAARAHTRQSPVETPATVKKPAREIPTIRMARDLDVVIKAAEDALIAGDAGVYTRAGELVRLVRDERGTSIQPLPRAALTVLLSKHAIFVSAKRLPHGSSVDVGILPPRTVVDGLAEQGAWRFPVLEAVVVVPTLRPDGSVLDTPGYDPDTHLFYEPSAKFPPVPGQPTRADAMNALALLHEPFKEFPFKDACHRSAALALALSVIGRGGYKGATPISVIRSPTPGTGKQALTQVIGILALDRDPPTFAAPANDEEWSKKLGQHVRAGHRFTVIDEVVRLDSRVLASAITLEHHEDRLLGTMDQVYGRLPVYATCGNNTLIGGDFGRRVVPIEIDSGHERPENRTFERSDLQAWTREHRTELVTAALTALRAYVVAGRPDMKLTPMGSFGGWSRLIRSALVWAGWKDPVAGQDMVRQEADVGVDDTAALLMAWYAAFGSIPMTTRTLVDSIGKHPELHELLLGLEKNPKFQDKLKSQRLGYSLRQIKNRPLANLVLRAEQDTTTKTTKWWVERSADKTTAAGDQSSSPGISGVSPVHASPLLHQSLHSSTGDAGDKTLHHAGESCARAHTYESPLARAHEKCWSGGVPITGISGTSAQPFEPVSETATGDTPEMPGDYLRTSAQLFAPVAEPTTGDAPEMPGDDLRTRAERVGLVFDPDAGDAREPD